MVKKLPQFGHSRGKMNRTLLLSEQDRQRLRPLITHSPVTSGIICGNCLQIGPELPLAFVDLLVLDPPYNLTKNFDGYKFCQQSVDGYAAWLDQVITGLKPRLKPTASVYICGDWLTSASIFRVASHHFIVRNRITWEREKGRGAKTNWKNASEDIWFCTMGDRYHFNVDAVKLRRRVLAPYRHRDGNPKDWQATDAGAFRDTHPSNFWSDITIPFWSMPENTNHPTQKSEKLMAKLILASSQRGDCVFDPFLGSGTTAVVAAKLGRRYLGIELNEDYCLLAQRRLELAQIEPAIQGFADGVFWERNTRPVLMRQSTQRSHPKAP
jgi:site-specific DNA-methyltransferase (adenine-specific)